jgi:hypothetical protein
VLPCFVHVIGSDKVYGPLKNKLETEGFRNSVANAVRASRRVLRGDLPRLLDADPMLICFDNGVLHLDEAVDFLSREEEPKVRAAIYGKEFVSKTTGYDFKWHGVDSPNMCKMRCVVANMFVKGGKDGQPARDDVVGWNTLDCVVNQLGSALEIGNIHQIAMFLLGIGSNGKTVLMNLIKLAMGDYAVFVDQSFWLQPVVGADKPAPLTVSMIGARFYLTSEIEVGSKINAGNFKSVVGSDSRQCRTLFSKRLHTCDFGGLGIFGINDMPEFSERGQAILRRVVATEFPFYFTSRPEFQGLDVVKAADEDLSSRPGLKRWSPLFFNLILQGYFDYVTKLGRKLVMSDQHKAFTKEVHSGIDAITPWAREWLCKKPGDTNAFELTSVLHGHFCRVSESSMGLKEFSESFAKIAHLEGYKKAPSTRWAVLRDDAGIELSSMADGKQVPVRKKGAGYNFLCLNYPGSTS